MPDIPAGSVSGEPPVEVHALSDVPSKLNSVRGRVAPGAAVPLPLRGGTWRTGGRSDRIASDRDPGATRPVSGPGSWRPSDEGRWVLLRKEVIQPHLPVRLPCYDFVPIADPTFDSSLPRVGPLASGVTDFRDVTGGVYKARERIHRGVADPRLLATPTSRGRVADPDPN